MITDTLVIKIVAQHKQGRGKTDDSYEAIERIKELGIYLEGDQPPTPNSFVKTASRFFSETPLRPPITPARS